MKPYKTSDALPPPPPGYGYGLLFWERGEDPRHPEAYAAIEWAHSWFSHKEKKAPRAKGWFAVEYSGNAIAFVPDGTEYKQEEARYFLKKSNVGTTCAVPENCIEAFEMYHESS